MNIWAAYFAVTVLVFVGLFQVASWLIPYLGPILSFLIVAAVFGAITYPFAELEYRLKHIPLNTKVAGNRDFINQIEFWVSDHVTGVRSLPSLESLSEQDLHLLVRAVQDAQMDESRR